ncbi:hypothetical protein RHSP_01129 [Rhizobium freirei PRF 81]|uniref:Uncharacterized protein n=1 Tax=Rhizobium freirei PRF 81 TaxID=363754 RepID=N6VDI9_9HYPH|nr:hypothetical protein [Rhizobium freirei]ENN89112.1 hypothetical protein RHSP_01129 [Rhizobium freirei PRF 81]
MEIEIKGKIPQDPRERVLAIEAVAQAICQNVNADPADCIMMLLTAAVHIQSKYSKDSAKDNITVLAGCLGHATVAAEGFFKLRPVSATLRAKLAQEEA